MKENILLGLIIATFTLYIAYIGAKTSDERMKAYENQLDAREEIKQENINYLR